MIISTPNIVLKCFAASFFQPLLQSPSIFPCKIIMKLIHKLTIKQYDFKKLVILCAMVLTISEFHCHAQNVRARHQSEASFSGRPHAPVNMVDSMEEVNVGEKKSQVCCAALRYISYAKFSQNLEVLWDLHRLSGYRNSPTTGILHTIRHVYSACGPPEKLSLALVPRCA